MKDRLEGVGWVTYEILKRLAEEHPEDEFLFFFDRPYDDSFVFGENVRPIVLAPQARHPFLFYAWFEWSVTWAIKRYKADVFLSLDSFMSLWTPVKSVIMIHDIAYQHFPDQIPWLYLQYYRYYIPRFLNRAEVVLTVSSYSKADLIKYYDLPEDKIKVAFNGCRDIFKPIAEEEQQSIRAQYSNGQSYFFYIGALHPRKNLVRLIQAFDQFRQSNPQLNTQLLLAGRFAWKNSPIKVAYEAAQFKSHIHFLGYVSDETLTRLIASAQALTYLSVFEGFGLPVLEAMHCETAILASNTSSIPEVAGDAALLVDPFDVEAIAEGMGQLANSAALRAELVEKGRVQRRRFSWENSTRLVYESLQIAAKRKKAIV